MTDYMSMRTVLDEYEWLLAEARWWAETAADSGEQDWLRPFPWETP